VDGTLVDTNYLCSLAAGTALAVAALGVWQRSWDAAVASGG
jgi:hypothetical protein